jgi:predicted metal-dependent hydrolase
MKSTIQLQGASLNFTVKKSHKAKNLRISMFKDNELVVTIPKRLGYKHGVSFAKSQISWICQHYVPQVVAMVPELDNKRTLLSELKFKVDRVNALYQFPYNKIQLKKMRTRWGSCSCRGNLSFNEKIFFLDSETQDYIIAHELCHLKEFNHSPNFWNLVAVSVPNYQEIRKKLRKIN